MEPAAELSTYRSTTLAVTGIIGLSLLTQVRAACLCGPGVACELTLSAPVNADTEFVACERVNLDPGFSISSTGHARIRAGLAISGGNGIAVAGEGRLTASIETALACDGDADLDQFNRCLDCDDQDGSSYPGAAEVCDDADNNCDGSVDEDSDVPVSNGTLVCQGGLLNLFCDSGWFDANDDVGDGCECQPIDTTDTPDAAFVDANCDGIDGDIARAIFVSVAFGGNIPGCGLSPDTPCASINYGIQRASESGRDQVYIQAGIYNERVELVDGISPFGGYDAAWVRDGVLFHTVSVLGGQNGDGQYVSLEARSIIMQTEVADLQLIGPSASGSNSDGSGHSSHAVYGSDANLLLSRLRIIQGNGAPGLPGSPAPGAGVISGAAHGGPGDAAEELNAACDDTTRGLGGSAGVNPQCGSGTGAGAGGDGGTIDTACSGGCCIGSACDATSGENGSQAVVYDPGSYGDRGLGGGTCGIPAAGGGFDGGPGNAGIAGNGGDVGGAIVNGYWQALAGSPGGQGQNGTGGGGGAGGISFCVFTLGSSVTLIGGGGALGCQGGAAGVGGSGGAAPPGGNDGGDGSPGNLGIIGECSTPAACGP